VELQLRQLPPGRYRLQQRRTGYLANDAHTAYLQMGSPKDLDAQQVSDMHKLTADRPELQRELRVGANGVLTLTVALRSHDVLLLSLTPIP
jgi:xylan 1,4-beta-xylosidase